MWKGARKDCLWGQVFWGKRKPQCRLTTQFPSWNGTQPCDRGTHGPCPSCTAGHRQVPGSTTGGLSQGPTGAVSAGSGFLKSRMEREALLSGGGDLARQGQGHGGQAPESSGDLPLACNTQQVCHCDWKNLKFNRGISSMNKSAKQRQRH